MGQIKVETSSRVTFAETPYFMIQAVPDRIKYQIQGGGSAKLLNTMISGATGHNSKIQEYLEVLGKMNRVDLKGDLFKAWLSYNAAASSSADPKSDQGMSAALDKFQRLACVGSSYSRLPSRAAKATFWEKASEVVLPRITKAEHEAMG